MPPRRSGMTLMEVILAMAIFALSFIALSELLRMGLRNAAGARDLTEAQLLCESKLAEIAAGIELPQPAGNVPFPNNPRWEYSIAVEPLPEPPGLLWIEVTVQEAEVEDRPWTYKLTRWLPDPNFDVATDRVLPAAIPTEEELAQ